MASPLDYNLLHASSSTERPDSLRSFNLHAKPGTDLWRKPSIPPVNSDNAPSLVTSVPLHGFRSAQVTVTAKWTRLYDQGGLVLTIPARDGDRNPAWVKTGIEFYSDQANLSTVATPSLSTSDWSLLPLTGAHSVTVRVEREISKGELSPTLWVYLVKEDGSKVAVREITWFFEHASPEQPRELLIGAYAARPTKIPDNADDAEELEVHFAQLTVEIQKN